MVADGGLSGPETGGDPFRCARTMARPPYPLVDKSGQLLLDVADLVFIDPPGTGFSYLDQRPQPRPRNITASNRMAAPLPMSSAAGSTTSWPLVEPQIFSAAPGESLYGTPKPATAMVVDELEGSTSTTMSASTG